MGYALRSFYEQMLEPHVAAAGSLVEFALGQISFPVGRIDYVTMRPMTFVEHLWAIGNDVMAGGLCLQTAYARQDAPTQSYRDDLVATSTLVTLARLFDGCYRRRSCPPRLVRT